MLVRARLDNWAAVCVDDLVCSNWLFDTDGRTLHSITKSVSISVTRGLH